MDQQRTSTSPEALIQHPARVTTPDALGDAADEVEGQSHDRMDVDDEDVSYAVELHPEDHSPPPRNIHPDLSMIPRPTLNSGSNTPVGHTGILTSDDLPRTRSNSTAELGPEEDDDGESGDESSNHEDDVFWSSYQPDNSSPSAEELEEMNRREEISAIDHKHWERATYEALDDPEYAVASVGRISWTIDGFHGTKDHPNRERIMRSPSVIIGGYTWNIKLLPRGDETTDFISLYVECTGPAVACEGKQDELGDPKLLNTDPQRDPAMQPVHLDAVHQGQLASTPGETQSSSDEEHSSRKMSTSAEKSCSQSAWNIAAQIGCVMYNPNEPRVRVHEKSAHNFENGSKDWGWVRFYGPWETIHQRQHLQRQALLHNDTVAFTAYIRTFKDDTKTLWWHPGKENGWNDLIRTGHRGMTAPDESGSAVVAALSAWVHLRPFQDIVVNAPLSSIFERPGAQPRPLYDHLKDLLRVRASEKTKSSPLSLEILLKTLQWHNWDLESNHDVFQIWETFQHLLNQEYYDTDKDESMPNVFKDFAMLRCADYASISATYRACLDNPQPLTIGAPSTQQLLDLLVRSFQGNAVWNKHRGILGRSADPPSVLQLQLLRQSYDTTARKWKRLTHRVVLEEIVTLRLPGDDSPPTEYTLSGIIVHAGKLGSGEYYTITRAGGQWLRYKCKDEQGQYVKVLTKQQAITAHEGTGNNSQGEAAVAYIALYARPDVLVPGNPEKNLSFSKTLDLIPGTMPASRESTPLIEPFDVQVFDSKLFQGWADRGMLDPWAENKSLWDSQLIVTLELLPHTTLREVKADLMKKLEYQVVRSEQVRLWAILATPREGPHNPNRLAPHFVTDDPDVRLYTVCDRDGICRLWVHIIPDPLVRTEETPSSALVAGSNPRNDEARVESLPNQSDPILEDAVMGGTQDEGIAPALGVDRLLANEEYSQALEESIYIFVKRFNIMKQELRGVGTFIVDRQCTIGKFLENSGLVVPDQKVDLFVEVKTICAKTPLSSTATFQTENLKTGATIIIQERLSPAMIKKLRQRGAFVTAQEYYVYLVRNLDPAFTGPRRQQNYFGRDYTDAETVSGRFHGQCVHISTNGNAYFGTTVAGSYSGIGTMYYSNGDTYTGDWADNEPNGQGQMVYVKTGNTYSGGWLNGKRHGKGVMQFEVADEELEICRICYEAQIDALFYKCGHVVACEACAKQVEVCPICRFKVDAVVKIWKA
ncbi:hypothetical protein MMC13_007002 [Lambiella insularis]|nr:hypothetical protein [Lambiella insularis]